MAEAHQAYRDAMKGEAKLTSLDQSVGTLETTAFLAGGSCLNDLTISVVGTSVAIPFSQACAPLGWLGNILVLFTGIFCAGIISRGVA